MRIIIAFILAIMNQQIAAQSCETFERCTIDKSKFKNVIEQKMHEHDIDVQRVLCSNDWHIIEIDRHSADREFLFYQSNPLVSTYQQLWSGVIAEHEAAVVKQQIEFLNPGINKDLANCLVENILDDQGLERNFNF